MPSPCRSHSTCQADLQSFANFPFPPPHRVDGNRDSVNCRDTLMLELWFCGCVCLCMYLPMESLQRRVSANASMLLCSPPQCQPLVVWHGWSWWSCVLVKWQGSRPWMGEINPPPKDPEIQQIQHAIAPPSTNIAVPLPFLASVQKIEGFRTTNAQGSPRGTNQ